MKNMAIHIGELIQKEVDAQRLTYKEFGALIHRNEKTIPDIYDRATMSIDLLIVISEALKKDFLQVFYIEEPMKSLRNDEVTKLQYQINILTDKTEFLVKELTDKQELINVLKGYSLLATERLDDFKKKIGTST